MPDDASSRIQQSESEKARQFIEIMGKFDELQRTNTDSDQAYKARVQKINDYFSGRILSARLEVAHFNLEYEPEKQLMVYNLEPIIDLYTKLEIQKRGINLKEYSFWPIGKIQKDYRGFYYAMAPVVYSEKCNIKFVVDPVNAEKIMQENMDSGVGPAYPEIKFSYTVDKMFSDIVLNEFNFIENEDSDPKNWSFSYPFFEAKVKSWEFIAQNGWKSSGTCE